MPKNPHPGPHCYCATCNTHYRKPRPTIADYFQSKLGAELEPRPAPIPRYSPHHADFHVATGCGVECRMAIDAAAEFLSHHRAAFGTDDLASEEQIIGTCRAIVRCYVYG